MSGPRRPWEVPGTNYNNVTPGPTDYQSHPAFGPEGMARQPVSPWAPAGLQPPLPTYLNVPAGVGRPGIANNGTNYQQQQFPQQLPPRPPPPTYNNNGATAAIAGFNYQQQQFPQQLPPRPPPPTYNNNGATAAIAGFNRPATSLMSYGSPYSSFGAPSMYGSPYSSYGGGFNRFGMSPYGYNQMGGYGMSDSSGFVQMAEESSRPAFQSIEAIVHAAGSVSMMLESTYSALYSSFRAVIGVAHHFGKMKDQVGQIVSALAIIRSIRWLYRKILFSMGLSKVNPTADQIWNAISKNMSQGLPEQGDQQRPKSSWPIIMFFAVIFGAPWLIWRILMSVSGVDAKAIPKWANGEGEHAVAVGLFDFQGRTPQEVSFRNGQVIKLAPPALQPQIQGWVLASVDGAKVGYVPMNHIKIQGIVRTPNSDGTPSKPLHNDPTNSQAEPQAAPHKPDASDVVAGIEEEWNALNENETPKVDDL